MKTILQFIAALLFLTLPETYSQTRVPSWFSDHMIIQQNEVIPLSGTDQPNKIIHVTASWGEKVKTRSDQNGKWVTEISTPPAGGPFRITVKGSEKIVLNDILTGDVWLCSGQSNMEMPVKGYNNQPVTGSNESILYSGNDNLRVYQVSKRATLAPTDDAEGIWLAASSETTPDFSATAYYFGQLIQEVTGIPIGLIEASWGGSNIEAWMDKATLENFPDISFPEIVPEVYPQQGATLLYNGMLHSFRNLPVKGVIWYQGESNRLKADKYKELFPALIHSWRTGRDQPDLPVYFVQIAPFNYSAFNDPPNAAALLKEAQLHVMKTVPNTGMVVTADIGDCQNIHPPDKKEVGRRLAYWALANNYNMKGVEFSGPVYRSMEPEDGQRIRIYFDYTSNGLTSLGYALKGFEIAGADRKFVPAQATIHADHSVSVWSNAVSEPVAVRYAFGNCVEGTLFNLAGLPASPFRTDKW